MHRFFGLLLLAGTLATASVAHAMDGTAGQFGGGVSGGLTGDAGAHVTYRITDQLGASATMGFYNFDPAADGVDSTGGFVLGAQGFYNFYMREKTHLGAVLGFGFGTGNIGTTRIVAGLRPEIWLTDYLAIHATFGLGVILTSEDSRFLKSSNFLLSGGGFGAFGATFYFGGKKTTTTDDEDSDDFDFDF